MLNVMLSQAVPSGDRKLIQIVDAALADAARRSGEWLVCRPACTQCCVGVFAINQLDAARLRRGLRELEQRDLPRARAVRRRAKESWERLRGDFPGDETTGVLDEDELAEQKFEAFADDEPCPALDPETGLCELYEARPMTCRTFGPPVRAEGGLGVCELCYHGATDEQIAACEMKLETSKLEAELSSKLEKGGVSRGETIVAYALAR